MLAVVLPLFEEDCDEAFVENRSLSRALVKQMRVDLRADVHDRRKPRLRVRGELGIRLRTDLTLEKTKVAAVVLRLEAKREYRSAQQLSVQQRVDANFIRVLEVSERKAARTARLR